MDEGHNPQPCIYLGSERPAESLILPPSSHTGACGTSFKKLQLLCAVFLSFVCAFFAAQNQSVSLDIEIQELSHCADLTVLMRASDSLYYHCKKYNMPFIR